MNKLFTKIAAALSCMTMAIGVGVAVGTKSNVRMASAADLTGTITMSDEAADKSWTNGTAYRNWTDISGKFDVSCTNSGYNGKYYTSDSSWRMYSGGTATVTLNSSISSSYEIKSVSSSASASWSVAGNKASASASFTGTVKITSITVTYVAKSAAVTVEATGMTFDEELFEVYAGEEVSFTPTLTGGSGDYEKTIGWVSDVPGVIASPENSESGDQVTVTPNNVLSETDVTLTGTVVSPGSASGEVLITVKPDTVDHYSVTGTATATVGGSWDLSALTLHAWRDFEETEEKTLTKGTSYSLTTSTAVGEAGNKTIVVTDSLSLISGSWEADGTVVAAPVNTTKIIDATNANQVATNSADELKFKEGVVEVSFTKNGGTAANNYFGQGDNGSRVYASNIITITAGGYKLVSVKFYDATTYSTGQYASAMGTSNWTGGTATTGSGYILITANSNVTSISHTSAAKAQYSRIDVIYSAPTVVPTSITLNKASITMTSYDEDRLVGTVLPEDSTDATYSFSGYDSDIIDVASDGTITPTGTKFGTTTVTATTTSGSRTATCSVTIERPTFKEARYTYSYDSGTKEASMEESRDIVDGSASSYVTSGAKYGTTDQLQNTKNSTLTITGMEGYIIQTVVVKMRSNTDTGTGTLTVKAGSTSLLSTTGSFATWYGEYSTDLVPVKFDLDTQDHEIGDENITIKLECSVSSLYLLEYRVRYVAATVDTSAVDFARKILDELSCTANGTSAPSTSEWEALSDYYGDAEDFTNVSAAGKQTLFETAAPYETWKDYEVTGSSTDQEIICAALAKYDYVVGKYLKARGLTAYNDFINRNPSPVYGSKLVTLGGAINESSTTLIIVIVSIAGFTALGGYFFLRKRKEQ